MGITDVSKQTNLCDAYRRVLDRIAAASERSSLRAYDVMMVAVTKNASPDQIRLLVEMGQADLGENRVQQLSHRVAQLQEFVSRKRTLGAAVVSKTGTELPQQVRWHMVGHLQGNKVKIVAPLVQLTHSIDSLRLAEALHTYAAHHDLVVDILIQVNASGEKDKFGVAVPAVIHLAEQINTMMHLRLRGLMTIAPYSENAEDARPTFARMAEIFTDLKNAKFSGKDFNVLSMGMSGDFEVAIEEGANLVRIGQALFGNSESG